MQTLRQLAQLRNRLPELIFAARDLVCGLRARRVQPAPVQGLLQFCEPAPGSVSAKDAITSPVAIGSSQRAFCSSVPNPTSTWPAMPLLVPNIDLSDSDV